jgi:hypothetical protein
MAVKRGNVPSRLAAGGLNRQVSREPLVRSLASGGNQICPISVIFRIPFRSI